MTDEITKFLLEAKRIQKFAVTKAGLENAEIYRNAAGTRLMIDKESGEIIINNGKEERTYIPESKYIFKKRVA